MKQTYNEVNKWMNKYNFKTYIQHLNVYIQLRDFLSLLRAAV